jgi:hypothetical protein
MSSPSAIGVLGGSTVAITAPVETLCTSIRPLGPFPTYWTN